jgi:phosphatidate cytidylyltransferase
LAGFIGGFVASIVICIGSVMLFPRFFPCRVPPLIGGSILGIFSGIAATLGDLAESALKRSARIKDSGYLIPGRGGVLDSIDSVALAAPVFYIFYKFLF